MYLKRISLCLIFVPIIAQAVTYTVDNAGWANSGIGTTGDLLYVINQLNSSGTPGALVTSNTINITSGLDTITLSSDLPVIQKGVTITVASGTQIIDGQSVYRLFATYKSSLSLSNLVLQGGLALGGTGGSANSTNFSGGGGGGLGGGGGVYGHGNGVNNGIRGRGGSYAGDGSNSSIGNVAHGAGGGGAGIGGAIFVGIPLF